MLAYCFILEPGTEPDDCRQVGIAQIKYEWIRKTLVTIMTLVSHGLARHGSQFCSLHDCLSHDVQYPRL